jgi:hypothetical protein
VTGPRRLAVRVAADPLGGLSFGHQYVLPLIELGRLVCGPPPLIVEISHG